VDIAKTALMTQSSHDMPVNDSRASNLPIPSTTSGSVLNMTAITRIGSCFLALVWTCALAADEIVLHRSSQFSLYVPSTCRKIEQGIFALALDCNFQGRKVRFYLKEFPGQLDDQFDPRKNPPPRENADAYTKAALRSIIDELEPSLSPRMKFFSGGSVTRENADARFWRDGYIPGEKSSDGAEPVAQCLFLRVLAHRDGLSAVLVSVSETDGLSRSGPLKCLGIPGEVSTILGSLDRNSEGFRFMHPD
jgi:hypothetical protein